LDLPPTLLDAAGIPVPESMQGRSILPLAQKKSVDWPKEAFIQISESEVGRAIRTNRWKYSVHAPDKNAWQDAASDVYEEQFLYDLHADPHELSNLIGVESYASITAELRERLIARIIEAGEEEPVIRPAKARKLEQRRVSVAEMRVSL
jgi:arylsulfatase A-like enzyme